MSASSAVTNTANQMSSDAARMAILDAIVKLSRPFTVGDIVAETGLPPYLAEASLSEVVRQYDCDLDVDDQGQLIYRFDEGLKAREDIVKADAARRRKEKLKQKLMAFFKVWTVAMVIVYFIVYVVMIIAAIAAMSRANDSRSSSSRRFGSGGGSNIFIWTSWGRPFGYGGYGSWSSGRSRRRYNRDVERRLAEGEDPYTLDAKGAAKKPSLSDRTWFHLFGTEGIKRNPLEREKELLTYVRAKRGFITNADIVALLGVTYEEADGIGTRLVATYDGEMDITDDGIPVYRFPNIQIDLAPEIAEQPAQLGYLWQVREKEHALRTNPSRVVPMLNVINIVLGLIVLTWVMPLFQITGVLAHIGLVVFPLTFSAIFLFLGTRRALRDLANKKQYERDSKRIAIYKLLFSKRTPVRLPGHEREIASVGFGSWSTDALLKDAGAIAEELRGELRETPKGIELHTPRVWAELDAVQRLRKSAASDTKVGRTVFSTRNIAGASPIGDIPAPGQSVGGDLADEIAALEKELG